MRLRSKMILSLVPVLVLVIVAMILFAYNSLQTSAQSEISSEADATLSKQIISFTDSLNKTYGSLSSLATQLATSVKLGTADRERLAKLIKAEIEANPGYLGVWTIWEPNAYDGRDSEIAALRPADEAALIPGTVEFFATESGAINLYWVRKDGSFVEVTGTDAQREEVYYADCFKNKTPTFTAYNDDSIHKLMVTISMPIILDGKALGVVGVDLSMEQIQAELAELRPYDTGYAMLFNGEGLVIAAPDKELVGKPVGEPFSQVAQEAVKNHSGAVEDGESPFTKEDVLTYYKSVKTTDGHSTWTFATALPKDKIFKESETATRWLEIIGLVGIIVSALTIFLVISRMVNALRQGVDYAKAVADGDLNQTYKTTRKDELGVLAEALGDMVANLKSRIEEAEKLSKEAAAQSSAAEEATCKALCAQDEAEIRQKAILEAAGHVDAVVAELSTATQNLSAQVLQAKASADSQRDRVAESSAAMENMGNTIEAVRASALSAAEASERVKGKAMAGEEIVRNSVRAIDAVQEDSRVLRTNIEALGDQAKSIGSIITVINDIADQTNLLALNAAIEAARAGEAGRGFAVVADEVRKLAEKTVLATKDVGDAIVGIQKGTEQSVKAVEVTTTNLVPATELVNKSGESLADIVHEAVHTAQEVQSITDGVELQAEAGRVIYGVLDNINVAAAETSTVMQAAGQTVETVAGETGHLQALVATLRRG